MVELTKNCGRKSARDLTNVVFTERMARGTNFWNIFQISMQKERKRESVWNKYGTGCTPIISCGKDNPQLHRSPFSETEGHKPRHRLKLKFPQQSLTSKPIHLPLGNATTTKTTKNTQGMRSKLLPNQQVNYIINPSQIHL